MKPARLFDIPGPTYKQAKAFQREYARRFAPGKPGYTKTPAAKRSAA